jgi:nucleoside 2-deoxyribosyltransferase
MSKQPARPCVYLAGPDVFFPERDRIFRTLKARCEQLGMVGLVPSDGGLSAGFVGSDDEVAQRIYDENIALLVRADGVVANLMNFRGTEPDSGTVYEVGFAVALNKPVAAYGVEAGAYSSRVADAMPCEPDGHGGLRETGSCVHVEGLGQRLNLMLSRSIDLAETPDDALTRLANHFRRAGWFRAAA